MTGVDEDSSGNSALRDVGMREFGMAGDDVGCTSSASGKKARAEDSDEDSSREGRLRTVSNSQILAVSATTPFRLRYLVSYPHSRNRKRKTYSFSSSSSHSRFPAILVLVPPARCHTSYRTTRSLSNAIGTLATFFIHFNLLNSSAVRR